MRAGKGGIFTGVISITFRSPRVATVSFYIDLNSGRQRTEVGIDVQVPCESPNLNLLVSQAYAELRQTLSTLPQSLSNDWPRV